MANEFSLIDKYFKPLGEAIASPNVVMGIGDDGALVTAKPGYQLALSSDMLVAGVHFLKSASPFDIGYKSLAVNLSDLAAMGAEPAWFSLCISLPSEDEQWLQGFAQGLGVLATEHQVPLVGGDTTQGPLTISIHVAGWVPEGQALTRSGAQVGDDIYVAGELGWPALGLQSLQQKIQLSDQHSSLAQAHLLHPKPQLTLARELREHASAALDISDGLTADLQHLLTASQVGARLETAQLPMAEALHNQPKETQWQALNFGDEYVLLFTAEPAKAATIKEMALACDIVVYKIGVITETQTLTDERGAVIYPQGYQHF